MVRFFPNRASCVRLIAAHCMEANEEWLGRRYVRMEPEEVDEAIAETKEGERPPTFTPGRLSYYNQGANPGSSRFCCANGLPPRVGGRISRISRK